MVLFQLTHEKAEAGDATVPEQGAQAGPPHSTASPVLQADGGCRSPELHSTPQLTCTIHVRHSPPLSIPGF